MAEGYRKLTDGKVSKADANYRESTDARRRCGTCSMFRPPASCTKVAGTISAGDVCRFWEKK